MIFHIPHSSTFIPDDCRDGIVLTVSELREELRLMTDWYTDEIFCCALAPNDKSIIFPISRLAVDPERFVDDDQEPMSEVGMGVIYLRTSHGTPLRKPFSAKKREEIINRYYVPHHRSLVEAVENEIASATCCLIIDCHSFPSKPLPYEFDQSQDRPDFCLGADNYHTPSWLVDGLRNAIESQGYSVSVNRPFSGSIVPESWFEKDHRVASIMIEINRRLYLDENTAIKSEDYLDIKFNVSKIIKFARNIWNRNIENR